MSRYIAFRVIGIRAELSGFKRIAECDPEKWTQVRFFFSQDPKDESDERFDQVAEVEKSRQCTTRFLRI